MSTSRYDQILEQKVIAVKPPILLRVGEGDCHSFVKQYERYVKYSNTAKAVGDDVKEEEEDGSHQARPKVLGIKDCIDVDLLKALIFEYGEKQFVDDDAVRAFLKERCSVKRVDVAVKMLQELQMDMRIHDVSARVAEYNMQLLQARERIEGLGFKEKDLVVAYVEGIRPEQVKQALTLTLKTKDGRKLETVVAKAKEMLLMQDQFFAAVKRTPRERPSGSSSTSQPADRSHSVNSVSETSTRGRGGMNRGRGSGRGRGRGASTSVSAGVERKPRACWLCGSTEHIKHQCPNFVNKSQNNNNMPTSKVNNVSAESESEDENEINHVTMAEYINEVDAQTKKGALLKLPLKVSCGGKKFSDVVGIVDSGASATCITRALLRRINIEAAAAGQQAVTTEIAGASVKLADGSEHKGKVVELVLSVPTRLATRCVLNWRCLILPDSNREHMLLGCDILREVGFLRNRTLKLPDLTSDIQLADDDGIDDAHIYLAQERNKAYSKEEENQLIEEALAQVISSVPGSRIKPQVLEILRKYREVFSPVLPAEGSELPAFEIKIKEGTQPVAAKARPLAPEIRAAVHAVIEDWRRNGVVKNSHSPWASPIVVVPKKKPDGTRPTRQECAEPKNIRVCADLRALNAVTQPVGSPMNDLAAMVAKAAGKEWYAKFDLMQGYLQMVLHEMSRELCAMVTPDDFVQPMRVLFGLKNAPQEFQAAMNNAFASLLHASLMIFIDDMLVYGDTDEEFLQALDAVLARAVQKRLRIKATKSVVGVHQVDCVGMVLSKEGRKLHPSAIAAVERVAAPRTVEQVRMFVGQVNYFREFIEQCSTMLLPLTQLTQAGIPFVWGSAQQEAFDHAKKALTDVSMLAYPDDKDGDLVLRTDASDKGLGGVLMLRTSLGDKPIAYFSKKFTTAEANWPTVEQELFAIVFCVNQRNYSSLLKARHFTVECDHRNLVYWPISIGGC